MRRFVLHRDEDVTGVSGTGVVAEGVILSSGKAVLEWLTDWPTSVVWHDRGLESVEKIHGHNGRTRIVWVDPPEGVINVDRRLSDDEYEDIKRRWAELHGKGGGVSRDDIFDGRHSETFPTADVPDIPRESLPPIPPALLATPTDDTRAENVLLRSIVRKLADAHVACLYKLTVSDQSGMASVGLTYREAALFDAIANAIANEEAT